MKTLRQIYDEMMRESLNPDEYNLYGEFDMEQHKAKYPHYLEVIIDESGKVLYAVPSHQEKLVGMMMDKFGWSSDDVRCNCPQDYYCDVIGWMCKELNAVSVWTTHYECESLNPAQLKTIRKLKMNGIYEGAISR